MKYVLSVIITFVTLLSAQELPGWGVYFGTSVGSAIYINDYDAFNDDVLSKTTPRFGISKGFKLGIPFILNVGSGKFN